MPPEPIRPSAIGKSVGAGVVAIVIGIIVCLITYALRGVEYGPLISIIQIEDSLYDYFLPPPNELKEGSRSIVFLDIDDNAILNWSGPKAKLTETPRGLIAALVQVT